MLTSVLIYALTLIGAVPLALPLALARGGRSKIARLLTGSYISFMLGTPLMLQLIAVYFGPWYLFRIRISDGYRFYAVIIAFVLNYAAYFAEIYRAGIAAVPKGQREAAAVLGYTNAQAFFRIVLPQVIKHILPHFFGGILHFCYSALNAGALKLSFSAFFIKNASAL